MNRAAPVLLAFLSACTAEVRGVKPIFPGPDDPCLDTVQPTFRWEPLPGAEDPRVSDLVYDVRVLIALTDVVVASGEDLSACEYRIVTPLTYDQAYTWTVRARFRWEGRRRETEWSRLRNPQERRDQPAVLIVPRRQYLPFRTPRRPESEDPPPP